MAPFPKKLVPFIWHFAKPTPGRFLLFFLLPLGWAIDQNLFPYASKMIIDTIQNFAGNKADIYTALRLPLSLGFLTWCLTIFTWRLYDIVIASFIPQLQANIRLAMLEYVELHSYKYFSENFAGSLANKIANMVDSSCRLLQITFQKFIPTCLLILLAVIILSSISPIFAVILASFFGAHMLICVILSKKCSGLSLIHSELRSLMQGKIVDNLTNILNIKLFSRFNLEKAYLKQFQNQEIQAHKNLLWYLFRIRVLLEIPSLIMIFCVMGYLIKGWQQGWISSGDFVYIIGVSFNIMIAVWRLGIDDFPDFFKELGICQQALSIINAPHEIQDSPHAPDLKVEKGEIVFDEVSFYYRPEHHIFTGKNIFIPSGQKVGLVGFSGSGKSTFVNLILRFFEIEKGEIRIDGQNIKHVSQSSLRSQVAMIPQDVSLFHRSLLENIQYGNPEATLDDVIEASKKAHCHEFIEQLPDKYQTLVGERGVKLSGGQRQRIALARAILKNAPILILDEATSALDSQTEKNIQESLSLLMQQRTTIVIAHRLSTLLGMDTILVFHHGQVIEQGTHRELLNKNGHYARLWQMQADGFLPLYEE